MVVKVNSPPPQAIAIEIAIGNWKAQALRAFVEVGLPDLIQELTSDGDHSYVDVTRLAERANLHHVAVYRLLRFLATFDVCLQSESCPREFKLGPVGEVVTTNHPASVAGIILWEAGAASNSLWAHLPEFLKTNEHVNQSAYGTSSFWDHVAHDPTDFQLFQEGMTSYSKEFTAMITTPECSPTLDLSPDKVICDLGCAEGELSKAMSTRFPDYQEYILADLPDAVERINLETMPPRFSKQAINFLESVPKADIYLLKYIIHDWDDEGCAQILKSVKTANPNATLLVMEFGPMPGPNQPHTAKGLDLKMGTAFSSQERSQEEYDMIWEANGFQRVNTHLFLEGKYPMYVQEVQAISH